MLADDFPRERRAYPSEQFHRYSPESTLTPLNDTPTVRTSRPPTHALNSTATAECCDADHISEASLPKGQDAASRGQVGAPGRPGPTPSGHGPRGSARRAFQALGRWPPVSFLSASKALGAEFTSGTLLPAASSSNIRQHGRVDKDLAVGLGNACAGQA